MGDFNIDYLAVEDDSAFKLKRQLQKYAITNEFEQLINTPTRIGKQTKSAIDLILVNNNHRIVESGVIQSGISNHSIVFCTIKSGVPKSQPNTVEYRSYRKYDKDAFVKDLAETNWNLIDIDRDVDPAVETWNIPSSDVANRHEPIKKTRIKGIKTPLMTSDLSNAMRDRDFHHRKAIKTNSKYHCGLFKKINCFVNKLVKKCKTDY